MNQCFDSISKRLGNGVIDGIALVETAAIAAAAGTAVWLYFSHKDRSAEKSADRWASRVQAYNESGKSAIQSR